MRDALLWLGTSESLVLAYNDSFIEGVIDSGCDVMDLGITTTGVLYRASKDLMSTCLYDHCSRNTPEYNGFKICKGTLPMAGEKLQELRETMERGDFIERTGKLIDARVPETYIETVIGNVGKPGRKIRVAIDCGNAVPGPLAITVWKVSVLMWSLFTVLGTINSLITP